MKTNPGGFIQPDEAIGRGELINEIWTILESQSVYMNAERRIGKTTILTILKSAPPDGWLPARMDLEGCHTALDFASTVYKQIHDFFPSGQKFLRRTAELLQRLGGTEIGGVIRLPEGKQTEWKIILAKAFEDLQEAQEKAGNRILFLWDEVPFMVDNIRKREGESVAMEVLDALRFARQMHPEIRMVLTGSVGLHHVLTRLKEAGYANAPVNDMAQVEVPPLTPENGTYPARQLLEGEQIECDGIEETSTRLAEMVDHFPYYIHHLVRQLKFRGQKASSKTIRQIVEEQLINPNDPWELKHYRTRIPIYYGADENCIVSILDVLAMQKSALQMDEISRRISSTAPGLGKERLRSLLTLMERDHYLRRTKEGYAFKFPLIRQWWRLDRSLA